jgi:hypothetical protein
LPDGNFDVDDVQPEKTSITVTALIYILPVRCISVELIVIYDEGQTVGVFASFGKTAFPVSAGTGK